jgi:hypothetical protein
MAFPRTIKFILFAVAGISLLVVLFFYAAPKTVNYDELEARVQDAVSQQEVSPVAPLPVVDTTAQDSAAVLGSAIPEPPQDQGAIATSTVSSAPDVNLREHLSGWEYLVWFRTDIMLIWSYVLFVITLLSSILFPLISLIANPRALVRLLVVLGGAAVLVVISYLLSSDKALDIIGYTGTDNSDPATLKMIDTVLFVTYMLFGLAIASILYSIVSKTFK